MTEHKDTEPSVPPTAKIKGEVDKGIPPPSIREILIGGFGFIVFLTVMILFVNAVGVNSLQNFVQNAGPWAPLAYITVKAGTYVFAPLTSGPIQVIVGTLFGNLWLGVLYTLIGEVIGGSISFWIARKFGRPVMKRIVGQSSMSQIENFYQTRMGGWVSLAVARVILFSVWDFLSYAAGLAQPIRFRTYVFVSFVFGAIPTFFFVWIGMQAFENPGNLVLIYGLVAVLILLPILFHKRINYVLVWASSQDKRKREN
ncbi:MAG: TVP38/TMEM64 family protein [Anaerolineae bacterium]